MTVAIKPKSKAKASARSANGHVAVAAAFDRNKYATLLTRALPVVVTSEDEYDQMMLEIKRLLRKGAAHLSPEEERLLDLLSTLAEDWEELHHPMPTAAGHRILQHYMKVRGVKATALQPIFGSRAATSAAVNGKRAITAEQATLLGQLFGVAPAVFA